MTPFVLLAHPGVGAGFASGFVHPLTGPDHLLAMVGVGIWASQLGKPGIWVVPVTFPLAMAVGAVLGMAGLPLPGVEVGVAASALAVGLMILLAARPPVWAASLLVGAFAIFHGYAHGAELPAAASPLVFGLGFVLATGLMHLTGITMGLAYPLPWGSRVRRAVGAGIAAGGLYFLRVAL